MNTGYNISALAKPLMGLFPTYWAIFGFRLLDRFGKRVRNAPRDALLAEVSTPVNRGRVFGFHRAADTLGATLGPLVTLAISIIIVRTSADYWFDGYSRDLCHDCRLVY